MRIRGMLPGLIFTFYGLFYRSTLAFPEDYRILVPKLLIETMTTVSGSFVLRLNLAIGDVVPETKALAKGCNFHFLLALYTSDTY